MALMKSLNSSISGLKAFKTRMDVIGNNIANVETAGYKSSGVTFSEMLTQKMPAPGGFESAPQVTNSVGLGVRVGSISKNFEQGSIQTTGRKTDMAIEGNGFFLVEGAGQPSLTRAGSFSFNKDGNLVDSDGRFVQGYNAVDGQIPGGQSPRDIQIDFTQVSDPSATQNVVVSGNMDAEAADGTIKNITTTLYDDQGKAHDLRIELEKRTDGDWNHTVYVDGTVQTTSGDPDGNNVLEFDATGATAGKLTNPTTLTIGNAALADFSQDVNIEFSQQNFTNLAGETDAKVNANDGYAQGQMMDFQITGDGKITGLFDNGKQELLGQIALAQVQNEEGLESIGNGLYRSTSASGLMEVAKPTTFAETTISSGALEGSNVDLADEFTDMISTQRAYQSSARIIRTADEMLQETVNLKR